MHAIRIVPALVHQLRREPSRVRATIPAGARDQLQAEHLDMRPGEIRGWNEKRDRVYYLALVPTLKRAMTSLGLTSGPLFRLANGEPFRRFPEQA
jgi:hypothetical protein